MSEDLPNGFTGFNHRKPGFVSAADAMRRNARAAEVGGAQSFERAASSGFANSAASSKFPSAASGATPASSATGASERDSAVSQDPSAENPFDLAALDEIPETDRRWAWVEIDLSAIRHNVTEARRHLSAGTRLLAVVKADAYGHGAVQVAKMALNSGAEYLAVATVPEALQLRKAGITAPLMVLAQPPVTSIPLLLGYNILPSVYDPEFAIAYAEMADAHGMRAPFHLAVNTGMNRIGVRYDEVVPFMHQVGFHRAIELAGVFTHFATADMPDTLDFQIQVKRFMDAIANLRAVGIDPGIVHCANSAALYRYPEVHFDMARLGISLYGFHSCPETYGICDLKPAMSVHARITDTRLVPPSEGVSYGLNYRSPGSVKICTVPLGYADGLVRGLSSNTDFILNGRRVRQVGNICMDQCMFEVDLRSYGTRERLDPQVGDEVIIVGRQGDAEVTIDEIAAKLNTIQHEIAIGFAQRMPRLYV